MSSYIVKDLTIDRILSFFLNTRGIFSSSIKRFLKKYNCDLDSTFEYDKILSEFGKKLLIMNCQAVCQRYKETTKEILKYEFTETKVNIHQALRSLQHFLYQCLEGTVPRLKLYKDLRDIEKAIMAEIIESLPETKKTEWG